MELRISVADDDDGQDVVSLYRWLGSDPDLIRSAALRIGDNASQPGTMGGVFDVIVAVVSNAIALGSLAVAFQSWRDSRQRPPAVQIEANGVVVKVDGGSKDTVNQIVVTFSRQIDARP